MKKLTTEEYVERCKLKHNNFYDYSKTVYTKDKEKVVIICPIHGEFLQRCDQHMRLGTGCKKCMGANISKRVLKTTDYFINKAIIIHGNRYDYSKSEYITAREKINIICPSHGLFSMTADSHIQGHGCYHCGITTIIKYFTNDVQYVIDKANIIHNNYYDYSKVNYVKGKAKVEIICPKHGSFLQNMSNHLTGKGCPECNSYSKSEKYIAMLLKHNNIKYIAQQKFDDFKNELTGRYYRFDFYIPSINTIIEYDGKQHFEVISIWNNDLKQTQYRDKLKTEYCDTNNIKLLRISFKEKITKKLLDDGIIREPIPNCPLF